MKSLDGDRHLRATLVAPRGAILARSTPLESDDPAPDWFYNLLVRPPGVVRVPVPMSSGRAGAIQLETDSRNEIGEAWDDATLTFTILVLFCSMSALLVHWIVGRALKPLNSIILAFQRVGGGDYGVKALESVPRELAQDLRRQQSLSVYVDGVRVNEAFGDTVSSERLGVVREPVLPPPGDSDKQWRRQR